MEWITGRRPELKEATNEGDVWVYDVEADEYLIRNYEEVNEGQPWMEIPPPEPYVKPKRYAIRCYGDFGLVGPAGYWCVYDTARNVSVSDFMPFEAAERIAATYEEVMP